MRTLKTLNKTSNYKILSALPIMGVCLTTTSQTSSAMFRSAFNSASRIIQNSTSRTLSPATPKVTYIYRGGSRVAITHSNSLKNSNSNQISGISTTPSPSSSSNTLRTSSALTTTPTPTPPPKPSLSVRPKTSASSNLQAQSISNGDPDLNNINSFMLHLINNNTPKEEIVNTMVSLTWPIVKLNMIKAYNEGDINGKISRQIINNDYSSTGGLIGNSIISRLQLKAIEKNPYFAFSLINSEK